MIVIEPRRPAHPPSPTPGIETRALYRFVFLSLLVHLLVLAVFGSAPGGSTRRGGGSSGSLEVTLRPLESEPGASFRLAPGADTRSPAAAILRRLGGAARTPPPSRPAETAKTPMPAAMPGESPAAPPPMAADAIPNEQPPQPAEAAPPTEEVAPPSPQPPLPALPQLNRSAPEEVDKPIVRSAPAVTAAPQDERPAAPPIASPPRESPLRESGDRHARIATARIVTARVATARRASCTGEHIRAGPAKSCRASAGESK